MHEHKRAGEPERKSSREQYFNTARFQERKVAKAQKINKSFQNLRDIRDKTNIEKERETSRMCDMDCMIDREEKGKMWR